MRSPLALSADERLIHGRLLLDYHTLNEDRTRFAAVASLLHPAVNDFSASPVWVGGWWWRLAHSYVNWGDVEAARTSREHAAAIAQSAGLADFEYRLACEDLATPRADAVPPGPGRAG